MRDREQDLYEIVGGFMLMTAVFFYFYGWHIKLLLFLVASLGLYYFMFVRKKVILYLMVSAVCMLLAYVSGENVFQKMYLCFGMALGIGGYFCGRQYGNSGMFAGISFSFLLLISISF